jgi:hypothetical protein
MAKNKQNGLKSANSSNISLCRLFRLALKAIKKTKTTEKDILCGFCSINKVIIRL